MAFTVYIHTNIHSTAVSLITGLMGCFQMSAHKQASVCTSIKKRKLISGHWMREASVIVKIIQQQQQKKLQSITAAHTKLKSSTVSSPTISCTSECKGST